MPEEKIYESPGSLPDDDLWLEQGRAMVKESLTSVRSAASSLMTGLGALQGIYLGILGFAKFVPEDAKLPVKFAFITPLPVWMIALYHCLKVMMTEAMEVNLNSPDEIKRHLTRLAAEKQVSLQHAFWWLFGGVVAAGALVVLRLKM